MSSYHMKLETIRRSLCDNLGRAALESAPRVLHTKWTHSSQPPPPTPDLPYGSLWSLINHIKVLHQYIDLLSEAASGEGVHAPLLWGTKEACTHGLEWFAPLLDDGGPPSSNEYKKHVDIWRQANPGLYSDAEAAYLVHQGYLVEDRNMTKFLVSKLTREFKEYEVDVAGSILRARPSSFEEFSNQFREWRDNGLYHTLCLAARNMPSVKHWVPHTLVHEGEDWQGLLDEFNSSSSCSRDRMAEICEKLEDRTPLFSNNICSLLDRVAILMRVKSNAESDLDTDLSLLQFPQPGSSYSSPLQNWGSLRGILERAIPPSLMCPSLYPPNKGAWGFRRLDLKTGDRLRINTGPITWMDKEEMERCKKHSSGLPDRLYDILTRMGDAATSPEMAHLMLSPETLFRILAGEAVEKSSMPDFTDRKFIINSMLNSRLGFSMHREACLNRLLECMPGVKKTDLSSPMHLLAWRMDCPPRAILYHGNTGDVNLGEAPPYLLPKSVHPDKVPNRTLSGISILPAPSNKDEVHTAVRACIAEEVVGPHSSFSLHPHHKVVLRNPALPQQTTQHTMTTLAEAVSFFTGPAPPKLSEVALNTSAPWEDEHVDDRYAERQTSHNGARYRDWVTVYRDEDELQRCRLASHDIKATKLYETHFPMSLPDGGHSWVSVASTLPSETRVLRHLGGKTRLEVLKRSVESRFMHDGKLMPVRNKDDKVERGNMEIYTDEKAQQVLIAYAPLSSEGHGLEFMSFRHV